MPTGMNMGVSETPWGRVKREALARPHCACTSNVRAGEVLDGSGGGGDDVDI